MEASPSLITCLMVPPPTYTRPVPLLLTVTLSKLPFETMFPALWNIRRVVMSLENAMMR